MNKALENIGTELSEVYENLRAETLIAEIQENSDFSVDDFIIANKGTFSRAYRRDIINIDDVLHDDLLTLNLSRNGLYDILPEGLFHVPHVSKGADSYTAQRKMVKKEEQDARQLFAPLEGEFFYQRLKVEHNERALLDDFYTLKDDFLINFWNVSPDISNPNIVRLIKLLPYSHKIAGDLELTRLCLEKILDEKVSFKKKYVSPDITEIGNDGQPPEAGFQLGVNSVLAGDGYEVLSPLLEVTIGPINPDTIATYLEPNGTLKFMERFYDYFLPMEIEAETKITVKKEVGFVLNGTFDPIMGISTYL